MVNSTNTFFKEHLTQYSEFMVLIPSLLLFLFFGKKVKQSTCTFPGGSIRLLFENMKNISRPRIEPHTAETQTETEKDDVIDDDDDDDDDACL